MGGAGVGWGGGLKARDKRTKADNNVDRPYPNCPKVMFSWKLRSSVIVSLAAELEQPKDSICYIIVSHWSTFSFS